MKNAIPASLQEFCLQHKEELYNLLKELCLIPAPSHFEDERAAFVKAWLENVGAEGVYIDSAKNVIFPYGCEGKDDLVVFAAHTDTVFPMETPLDFKDDGEKLYCPGVGDDTVCVVDILMTVKYLLENGIKPKKGILFVLNACEEGLGNLMGTRQLFEDYKGRIERFYTYDGGYDHVVTRAVGSYRYRITAETCGGHSWGRFGNRNAIQVLAKLIEEFYSMQVPAKENSRTTFNVGTIAGGTSVNTIAQSAEMLFEYRSNDPECIDNMTAQFEEKLAKVRSEIPDATISVETVGIRPCGEAADKALHEEMIRRSTEIYKSVLGEIDVAYTSGSTDCNIPLSLGVSAVCVGTYKGGGAHTREEWLWKNSLDNGFLIGALLILDYCE